MSRCCAHANSWAHRRAPQRAHVPCLPGGRMDILREENTRLLAAGGGVGAIAAGARVVCLYFSARVRALRNVRATAPAPRCSLTPSRPRSRARSGAPTASQRLPCCVMYTRTPPAEATGTLSTFPATRTPPRRRSTSRRRTADGLALKRTGALAPISACARVRTRVRGQERRRVARAAPDTCLRSHAHADTVLLLQSSSAASVCAPAKRRDRWASPSAKPAFQR